MDKKQIAELLMGLLAEDGGKTAETEAEAEAKAKAEAEAKEKADKEAKAKAKAEADAEAEAEPKDEEKPKDDKKTKEDEEAEERARKLSKKEVDLALQTELRNSDLEDDHVKMITGFLSYDRLTQENGEADADAVKKLSEALTSIALRTPPKKKKGVDALRGNNTGLAKYLSE